MIDDDDDDWRSRSPVGLRRRGGSATGGRRGGRGRGRGRGHRRSRIGGRGQTTQQNSQGGGAEDMHWMEIDTVDDVPPTSPTFSQQPGPRVNLPNTASPFEFFRLFFDDALITMLVDGTNEYAQVVIAEKDRTGKLTPGSRWRKWRPVTLDEMKAVLAIVINMGVIHCPEVEDYWKSSWESYIPMFHDILPRNRFQQIFWMLHLPTRQQTHRLDKVKPLLNVLLGSFQSSFYPGCEVSVDESMVGFKGRVAFKQYCPLKPTKHGLKAFVLSDSRTGYVLNVIPYTGREVREQFLSSVRQDLPVLAQIVVALLENYLDKGHHLYADRLYSSVPLVDELEKRKTGYTGTLNVRRRQLPSQVRARLNLQPGDVRAWRDGSKMVLAWKDKGKPTLMISSVHPASMTTCVDRLGRSKVKPLVVDKYNQSMGGVDKADQFGVYYSFDRRSVKWWRKLMFWLLEVSIVNTYILYRETVVSPMSHADFGRNVVVGL